MAGYGFDKGIATETANGWRYEIILDTDRERELLPGQPFIGYGETRQDAAMEAINAYIASLHELSEEDQASLEKAPPWEARLIGATSGSESWRGHDEAEARAWAEEERKRRIQPDRGSEPPA